MQQSLDNSMSWLPRLLRLWALLLLITFAVMLSHRSDDPIFLNRYSLLVATQLAGLLLLSLSALGAALYLRRRPSALESVMARLHKWRSYSGFVPGVLIAGSLLLAGMWAFYLGNHLPTYAFLRVSIGISIIIWTLALAFGGMIPAPTARWRFLPWLAAGLISGFAVITAAYYPSLAKTDEAFVFSMARNFLETGHSAPTIYRQVLHPDYGLGVFWIRFIAAWIGIVGLGLSQGRLYITVIGFISIALVWSATARLYNRTIALFTLLVGAAALISIRYIRPEIQSLLFISCGFFFYSIAAKHHRAWAHFLAGLAFGLALDGHMLSYAFGLGIGLVYLAAYIRHIRTTREWLWKPFWLLALGGILGAGFFFATARFDIIPTSSEESFLLANLNVFETIASGRVALVLTNFVNTFLTYQPILFGLTIAGLAVAAYQRKPGDTLLLVMVATWLLSIALTYTYFPVYYVLLGVPLCAILSGRALSALSDLIHTAGGIPNAFTTATACLLSVWMLVSLLTGFTSAQEANSLQDLVETGRLIGQLTPEDALIVAAEPYYFGLLDHPAFTAGAIEERMVAYRNVPLDQVWSTIQPDALVFSEHWSTEPGRTPALLAYMDEHNFGLRACYDTESFGRVELWTREATTPPENIICTPMY